MSQLKLCWDLMFVIVWSNGRRRVILRHSDPTRRSVLLCRGQASGACRSQTPASRTHPSTSPQTKSQRLTFVFTLTWQERFFDAVN